MIQPINNAMSFKGFYTNKNSKFSESQNKTVQDIKTKLEDESHKHDFFLNQGKYKDSISLTEVYGLMKVTGEHHSFSDKLEIGTYDEEHPFDLKDLKSARDKRYKNTANACFGLIAMGMITMACILGGKSKFIKMPTPVNKTSIVQDSLAYDSSKILKDAFVK